jgi:hypothetical protein
MKKSTQILVGGVFLIAIVLGAESVFHSLGMDFGPTQVIGSAFAGLVGALKLVS